MSGKLISLALTGLIVFTAPAADAASIFRTFKYFPVTGSTAEQLDHSMTRNGPKLDNGGPSHPGATKIVFEAKVRYKHDGKYCRISNVTANIHATITLPKWKNRRKADSDTVLVWNTLVRDIRRHEESHAVIARAHASEMEQQIRNLRYQRDCAQLRKDVDDVTAKIFADHDKAQQLFDRVETINFETRFERLLTYQLEKHYNKKT